MLDVGCSMFDVQILVVSSPIRLAVVEPEAALVWIQSVSKPYEYRKPLRYATVYGEIQR